MIDLVIRILLPCYRQLNREFVQLFGKVTADGTLDTIRINNMGGKFDLDNYDKALQLAKGPYANLFE